MIVALIILFIFVALEFLLILGLAGRQEEIKRSIKEINDFLEKYTEKNQKAHDKTTSVLEKIANKIVEMENGN